jgi:hypothetical protein
MVSCSFINGTFTFFNALVKNLDNWGKHTYPIVFNTNLFPSVTSMVSGFASATNDGMFMILITSCL